MKPFKNLTMAFIAIVLAITATPSHAATKVGKTIESDVRVTAGSGRVLKQGSPVFENDRLKSNRTGVAQLEFRDGTRMVIGNNATVVLDETVISRGGSQFSKFVVNTTSGAMRFISGESNSTAYEINTPTGTLGLRGTAFDMQHYRGQTYIMLISGKVRFCDSAGNCTNLNRRCDCMVIGPNGVIQQPAQPEKTIYTEAEMEIYFPFIADQDGLLDQFKQRIKLCTGGSTDPTITGDDPGNGGEPDPGDNNSGGGDTSNGNATGGNTDNGDSETSL